MNMNMNNVDLSAMTVEQLRAHVAALQAQVAEQQTAGTLTAKVSKSGAISLYGLMRFPVTLHVSQWERLAQAVGPLLEYAKRPAIRPLLSAKGKDVCHNVDFLKMVPSMRIAVKGTASAAPIPTPTAAEFDADEALAASQDDFDEVL